MVSYTGHWLFHCVTAALTANSKYTKVFSDKSPYWMFSIQSRTSLWVMQIAAAEIPLYPEGN